MQRLDVAVCLRGEWFDCRGETVQQGEKGLLTSKEKKGSKYVPSFLPPGFNALDGGARASERDSSFKSGSSAPKDKPTPSRKKGEQKVRRE